MSHNENFIYNLTTYKFVTTQFFQKYRNIVHDIAGQSRQPAQEPFVELIKRVLKCAKF